jgi:hypothetical protein
MYDNECANAPLRRTVPLAIRTVPIFASSSSSSARLPYAYAFELHSTLRLPESPSNPKPEAAELDAEPTVVVADEAADASAVDKEEDEGTPALKSPAALVTAKVTAANMGNDDDDNDDDDDDGDDIAAAFLTVNTHASSGSSYTVDTRPAPAAAALPAPPRFATGLIGASASPSEPGLEGLRTRSYRKRE